MLAIEIRIRIDHFRFEPQSEFHAKLMHGVNERRQSFRPYVRINPPIAQTGMVVTAQMEPAVIEHIPFHSDAGRTTCNLQQSVKVVIEHHTFPYVEDHRLLGRMLRQGTLPCMQACADAVQTCVGRGDHHPRSAVGLVFAQRHLTGG